MPFVMLRFNFFGFPVMVHWIFWVIAFLFSGGMNMHSSRDWPHVFVGMVVIFISILVHEMGHATTARLFGQRPGIVFHGMGGFTYFSGEPLNRWKHFLVVLSGPASSLALAGCFVILLPLNELSPLIPMFISFGLSVNLFWTAVNCLPVLPLDGGQMLRDLLHPKRERVACVIGAMVAVGIIFLAIRLQMYVLAVLMGFLAYSNFKGSTNLQGGVVKQ